MKRKLVIVIGWILVWEILSLCISNPVLMAGPYETLKTLCAMACTAEYWLSAAGTLARAVCGILAGFICAAVLGWISYRSRIFREITEPLFSVIKSVPVVSFIVLILLWTGGKTLSFYISWIVVLPLFYFSFLEGFASADEKYLEMAKMYRMSRANEFRYIRYPALYAPLCASVKSAVGLGFKSAAAAEVIGQVKNTVGNGIYLSKVYLSATELFAWTITVAVMAYGAEKIILFLLSKAGGKQV